MTKNTGGPAFPFPVLHGRNAPEGMTLRDYFAAKAMQALIAVMEKGLEHQIALVPAVAYGVADAMLAEREK